MPYSACQRGACEEDQAEKPHCPVKLCSYFIAQVPMKQRLCKVVCEKEGGEGGKKENKPRAPEVMEIRT